MKKDNQKNHRFENNENRDSHDFPMGKRTNTTLGIIIVVFWLLLWGWLWYWNYQTMPTSPCDDIAFPACSDYIQEP